MRVIEVISERWKRFEFTFCFATIPVISLKPRQTDRQKVESRSIYHWIVNQSAAWPLRKSLKRAQSCKSSPYTWQHLAKSSLNLNWVGPLEVVASCMNKSRSADSLRTLNRVSVRGRCHWLCFCSSNQLIQQQSRGFISRNLAATKQTALVLAPTSLKGLIWRTISWPL